ncbi:flagellar hook protein FlgE [Ectothiorhodospira shaposhnikovii]|uniref:flagellar hook protein FlgE n=2 Tax=Ectothiorhodospira shaposhnikovii TaxID=1054 RepID=UPI0039A13285
MNLSSEADPLGGVQHVNLRGEVTPQELLNVLTVPGGLNDIDDITIALNAAGEVEIQNNTGQELRFGSPSNVVVPGDGTATQLDASVLQPGQRLTWNFDGDLGTGRTSELPATVTANYLEAAISGLIPGVTAVAQADGSINVTNNTSNPVTINFPGGEFSLGTSDSGSITAADIDDMEPGQFITLTSAGEVQAIDPQDPDTFNYSTSLTVYDSLGSARTVSLFVQRQPPPEEKTWDVAAYMDIGGEQVKVGESKLAFKNDGTLDKTATQPLVLSASGLPNGAADLNIEVDFGQTTQYGNKFSVAALRQDGYAAGQLVSVDVDTDGTVFARYSNGANRPLGQVALANFDNPQGLQPVGGTNWVVSSSSGEPLLGRGGESNFGLIQGGAYEAANVNIADQLVKLITAQRNFQANAQVISTADTLTQTIINIR